MGILVNVSIDPHEQNNISFFKITPRGFLHVLFHYIFNQKSTTLYQYESAVHKIPSP